MSPAARIIRLDGRRAVAAVVCVAEVALALAGGGYGSIAPSAGVALAWIAVLGVVLSGRIGLGVLARPPFAVAAGALLAFGAMTAVSLGWSPDRGGGFVDVVRLAGYLGAFVLAGLVLGAGRGASVLRGLLLAILAVSLISTGSRLLGIGAGDAGLVSSLPPASGRLSFPLGYWNALGALMAMGIPLLIATAAAERDRRRCGLWLAAAVPITLAMYMTSSRGALLAAVLGAGIAVACSRDRPRSFAVFLAGLVAALPAVIAAEAATGILDSAGSGSPGTAELAVVAAALVGAAAVALVGPAAVDRLRGLLSRVPLPPSRVLVPMLAVAAGGLILLLQPSKLIDEFQSVPAGPRAGGLLLSSGSGRSQFWSAALEAAGDNPVRGIGAGGFPTYWNQHGELGTPTRNAHSEPLEALAELGILGCALFLVFAGALLYAGWSRARGRAPADGAAFGLLGAAMVGFLIDWTWQVPAVTVPVLVVGAGACVGAFSAVPAAARVPRWTVRWTVPAGVGLAALACASIWAAGALGVSARQLDRGEEALTAGDAAAAAGYARSAAELTPWDAEPYMQLAAAEQSVGNIMAAQADAEEALRRSPDDFRAWFLVSKLTAFRGESKASFAYLQRSIILAPKLFTRLDEFIPAVRGFGT